MDLDSERVSRFAGTLTADLDSILKALKDDYGWAPGAGSQSKYERIMVQEEKAMDETLPRTEKGDSYSRSGEELDEFRQRSRFIDLYLRYESLSKMRNVFLKPLEKAKRKVYAHFNELVNTGRTSCGSYVVRR